MLLYLGWIAAAFMAGFALARQMKRHGRTLQRRISCLPVFRGKTYGEILRAVGADPQTTVQRTDGHTLRTWCDPGGYSISLLFDDRDLCLGVEEEHG
ncbi:MAG: hypothetical protein IKH77_06035 [Clostridia bacterium]|nr:hypothetical protein [Clostridia bacterium]